MSGKTLSQVHAKRRKAGRPSGSRTFDPHLAQAFGAVIRARRLELGLSQTAIYMVSGTDRVTTSALENGVRQPSLEMIFRMAKALRCEPWQLVMCTEDSIASEVKK